MSFRNHSTRRERLISFSVRSNGMLSFSSLLLLVICVFIHSLILIWPCGKHHLWSISDLITKDDTSSEDISSLKRLVSLSTFLFFSFSFSFFFFLVCFLLSFSLYCRSRHRLVFLLRVFAIQLLDSLSPSASFFSVFNSATSDVSLSLSLFLFFKPRRQKLESLCSRYSSTIQKYIHIHKQQLWLNCWSMRDQVRWRFEKWDNGLFNAMISFLSLLLFSFVLYLSLPASRVETSRAFLLSRSAKNVFLTNWGRPSINRRWWWLSYSKGFLVVTWME